MKNEILDDVFFDELKNRLQPEEELLWKGRPYETKLFFVLFLGFLIYALYTFLFTDSGGHFIPLIFIAFIYLVFSLENGKLVTFTLGKQQHYFVTNQRVIFQTKNNNESHFLSIPFEDIFSSSVNPNRWGRKNGTVFMNIKNSSPSALNLKKLKRERRPTFNMINNAEEVSRMIKKGIKKQL